MIYLEEMKAFTERYAKMEMEPLAVTARLRSNSTVVNYHPVHLSSLIAWSVVQFATNGAGLLTTTDFYWQPLPLQMVWQAENGLPLWAASALWPIGEHTDDVVYNHKFAGMQFSRTKRVKPTVGEWQSRQKMYPVLVCHELRAFCIGNRKKIEQLLSIIDVIGKGRGRGTGAWVMEWVIEPASHTVSDVFVRDGIIQSAFPSEAEKAIGITISETPVPTGWTPPYWLPSTFMPGYAAGTNLQETDEIFWDAVGNWVV